MQSSFSHTSSPQPDNKAPATDNCNALLAEEPAAGEFISLEQVELEILLTMKIEDGLSFDDAVRSSMANSGNEFLFSFPPERFPLSCRKVACIRINGDEKPLTCYLYQQENGGAIEIADPEILDEEFHSFAESFVGVMEQMRDLFPAGAH